MPVKALEGMKMDSISGTIIEMCLIVEGAISLYEKNPQPDTDAYSLIGEALHMIQDRANYCLLACQTGT